MKKLLVGLLLVGSALSFGATQRVSLEKLGPRGNGRELYLEGQAKPYSGEVERKYPDGKLLGLATMKDGKLEGKAYEYYESGKVFKEEIYVNGTANGVAKSYYENGKVQYETKFVNGKREGIEKGYTNTGVLV